MSDYDDTEERNAWLMGEGDYVGPDKKKKKEATSKTGEPPAESSPAPPTETPPRKELMSIAINVRRAATSDLEGRCKQPGAELRPWDALTWPEKLELVRGFVSKAEAAGVSPEEFAERRRIERGDPPFSSGGCVVL